MCETIQEKISAFIDGELCDNDRLALMAHLADCPQCKAYFEDQLAIHEAMAELEEAAPAGFAQGVMARVAATKQEKRRPARHWTRWAAAAACCALAVLGVFATGGRDTAANQVNQDPALYAAVRSTGEEALQTANFSVADDTTICYSANAALPEEADAKTAPAAARTDSENVSIQLAQGAITVSGDTARRWVEEAAALEWRPGGHFALTAEQFAELIALLEEADEDFLLTAGEEGGFLLYME